MDTDTGTFDADPADPADPDPADPDPASSPASAEPSPAPARASGSPWWIALGIGAAAIMLFLVASQVYLVTAVNDTRNELTATRQDLDAARTEVALLEAEVAGVSQSVEEVSAEVGATATPSPGVAAPTSPVGYLPQYVPGQPDAAVGMTLAALTGPDAYAGTEVTIDPADGQKRIWMVWAHWCPYCQDELPALAASYDEYTEQYPGISIATVTTSIDPTRGNPLDAYLETSQFPFPVLVDEDSSMAAQFGVNAFPFWVVTDGNGVVLLRSAGYLDEPQLASLLESLDAYDA